MTDPQPPLNADNLGNEELAKALYLSDLGGWSKLPGTPWEDALEETREYWRERAAGDVR